MECITLNGVEIDANCLNLSELASYLNQLNDPRDRRGRVYELGPVLVMIIMARLAGQDKPSGVFEWIRYRTREIARQFRLSKERTPCLNTIRTILSKVIGLDELEKVFSTYLIERFGGQSSVLICVDGKTMRGTIPKGATQGVHLLTAYLAQDGVVLKQLEVEAKTNEIGATPQLLDHLHLKNKVVVADALHTQRAFCIDILSRGGDYLLIAKDNQITLREDIERFFKPPRTAPGWHIDPLPRTYASNISKGHGRLEKRTLTLMEDSDQFIDWPGLSQVFKLERDVTSLKSGERSLEIEYGLTSCSPEKANAETLLEWTRQYWQIENGLHYRRDVTLKEDETRLSDSQMARAIALINNFIISVVNKLGFKNLAAARRKFDASIAKQLLV